MPFLRVPIPDLEESLNRPIIFEITRYLNQKMGFDENTPIFYPGESGVTMQLNSKMNPDTDRGSKFASNELITIEVDEQFDPSTRDTPVMSPEYMPIFRDDNLGIILKPVYMPTILNITYKYRCVDKNQAEMWRNKMRSKSTYYGDINHHRLTYFYLIPEEQLFILEEINKLRNTHEPYNQTFSEYLLDKGKVHGSVRISRFSNLSGKKTRLGVSEKQTRVFGKYDFDVAPEKGGREGENVTWTASFNYRIQFSKPTELVLRYPIMVHQNLMEYIPTREDTMYEQGLGKERHFSLSGINMEMFTSQEERRRYAINNGIMIPDFDEFLPKDEDIIPGTRRIFDALLSLSSSKPGKLINLTEIENVSFGKEMQDFLKGEAKYMKHRGRSVIQLSLFNQWSVLHPRFIEVDDNLNVKALRDLTLRNTYHVRMSLYHDWTELDHGAIERLKKYPNIVKDLVEYLGFDWNKLMHLLGLKREEFSHVNTPNKFRGTKNPWRNEHGKLVTPPDESFDEWKKWKKVPDYYMWEIIHILSGKRYHDLRGFTVQTFWVEAYRKDNLDNVNNTSIHYY